jgi:hypothetical protein
MVAKVSKPTAMTVSRIINESVITKAKPLDRRPLSCGFMAGSQNQTHHRDAHCAYKFHPQDAAFPPRHNK